MSQEEVIEPQTTSAFSSEVNGTTEEPAEEIQTAPEETTTEEETTTPEPEGIQLDGRTFATQEEAFQYLQTKNEEELAKAYHLGQQEASKLPQGHSQQEQETPTETEDDFDEEEFYTNPKEALKKYGEKIYNKAVTDVQKNLTQKEIEAQTWNKFTELHPDLADFQEDVDSVASKHAKEIQILLQTKDEKAAMDFVARKTRAKFQAWAEKLHPTTEMPRTNARTSSGTPQSVTPTKKESGPVDFTAQMRQHQKQRRNLG